MANREMDLDEYDQYISSMRHDEYSMLSDDSLYLDHAGTTLYSKRLMGRFHTEMMANLYGNPHSASPSSQRSTQMIQSIRLQCLRHFHADPEHFDLVFTANTTAAIKLVADAMREVDDGFWFGYHVDSHTSLVGVRELAMKGSRCFEGDAEFAAWLDEGGEDDETTRLFAYPAQSNMNGRRLPLEWSRRCRARRPRTYTLLDAAAYAATSPLRLDDPDQAHDFTVLSFSKMFGFPDLGALIVKKDAANVFDRRRYFGGGTVDMVVCLKEQWHAKKSASLHERLEDGTLPVHSISALKCAMETHQEIFRSLEHVAKHTAGLAKRLYDGLKSLRHGNGTSACKIYTHNDSSYGDTGKQGPTVAFNLLDRQGRWVSNNEIEKLASIKNIHLRTGGLCNPGGTATNLNLAPWEMRENFSSGFRCGSESDILNGKPSGVVRVSLGAMSTRSDVERFIEFVKEFFVDKTPATSNPPSPLALGDESHKSRLYIESLTVYPIKSCGGWQVASNTSWDVHAEGLAWDREWCIINQSTGAALSQKAYPRMALIRPQLDFQEGVLRIKISGQTEQLTIPLSKDPSYFSTPAFKPYAANVCGDPIKARIYTSSSIADFFTRAIGIPCTLARFPASASSRHSKTHLKPRTTTQAPQPILLSNESPILTITRSSLNRLNETIKLTNGKAPHPSVFRANIVLAESPLLSPGQEQPWVEDTWSGMRVGGGGAGASGGDSGGSVEFDFLGGCRRCQMVCVDQESGERNQEPFVTLAKTRRFGSGRVLFGVHTALRREGDEQAGRGGVIKVGDVVEAW
ncbi:hypothetical protein M409DRAFT_65177 [Zasmidium cellare ATCC 36951]|uniref:Molybdenum cofactor sulfurase n=1 Tax=Zasmidium cellare ATCC 36951 TaxID=1080233 RepID=A0A6A6CRG7_ZASCE|nr:uncharacterized protein M409DRAFT_65177 [Zasmidium cellare ATCC 36951]KAF2168768.1 hypothetical protein M409DRAFT_65177 [Zasmidium cellare ATCC 36951]